MADSGNDSLQIGKHRITQVFRYLQALDQHRNPPRREIDEQLWSIWFRDLPDHPVVKRGVVSQEQEGRGTDGPEFVLRVGRPKLTRSPEPPESIAEWLKEGWEDPEKSIHIWESKNRPGSDGQTKLVGFEEAQERVQALEEWRGLREEWARNERPARRAMKVFEHLYEIKGRIEREAESIELVLGDGMLSWRRTDGSVYHPILLQRLVLSFDAQKPEFTLSETETPVELYSALFQSMPEVDGVAIARYQDELAKADYHPLGGGSTAGFLRGLLAQLSARAEYCEEGAPARETDDPKLGRDPIIFLRRRNLGFAMAIEKILEDLASREDLPASLLRIVGIDNLGTQGTTTDTSGKSTPEPHPEDILLSKPTNPEQVQIAQRLEQHGAVLVQGPPGTGKTHSIANLIGHLLAQGKSILVTSHTTKALRVLRAQVVEELRPLCVSMLDSDASGRDLLKSSVEGIVEQLSRWNASQLQRQADELARERRELLGKLRQLRREILNARVDEYWDIVVSGQSYPPSEAARQVAREKDQNGWIPSPVTLGIPLPLSEREVRELYRSNLAVSRDDEREMAGALPNPKDLLSPDEFESLVQERASLSQVDRSLRADLWQGELSEDLVESMGTLALRLQRTAGQISAAEMWQLEAMTAGKRGGASVEPWDQLLSLIDQVNRKAEEAQESLLRFGPVLSPGISLEEQYQVMGEIVQHLEAGGKLGKLSFFARPKWRQVIRECKVGSGEPTVIEHFHSLRTLANLQIARLELTSRWDRQMARLKAPASADFGECPEQVCSQFITTVRSHLRWYAEVWEPIKKEIESTGFIWDTFLLEQSTNPSKYGELFRLRDSISGPMQDILTSRLNAIRWVSLERILQRNLQKVDCSACGQNLPDVVLRLKEAITKASVEDYGESFLRLMDLHNRKSDLATRLSMLTRLEAVAPGWSEAIRSRAGIHGAGEPPRDVAAAWLWRQLNDELERRGNISLPELEDKANQLEKDLQRVTVELIDRSSWAAQLQRTKLSQQQALMGWLDLWRRIGAGTGVRVPILKREANRLMSQCKDSVPVWIMPLARVAESFDPTTTRFDVVIIDEASQSDVMALLAFYLARKVVIVGDHEQVSPSAVGQDLKTVQNLMNIHLQGIPNWLLYDGKTSVYDLARQSFGGTLCLLEHFRCVPEIIQFSNHLSYEGRIKPLRDPSQVLLKPHVIPYRVQSCSSEDKVNTEEAWTVTALLVAASEQPEYGDKTFGVVSLVGDEQALEIERTLRHHMSPENFEYRHRILCGNASQFQGDERDVIFLSMVDTSVEGPLRLRQEALFKQRFNVAASRAKDQMWIVHSIDPRRDLKEGDLRRRLIEYAEDPLALIRAIEQLEKRTESEFEKAVARKLVQMGYRVHPQWKVGYYRIDLVVEGAGRRLAIECDGDRFHPIEKLPEDMARQSILERLGWRFVRIRGSQFFREPDRTMRPVIERLISMEIPPEGNSGQNQMETTIEFELKSRVIRRAEELLRKWRPSSSPSGTSADGGEEWSEKQGGLLGIVEENDLPEDPVNVSSDSEEDSVLEGMSGFPELGDVRAWRTIKDLSPAEIRQALHSLLPDGGMVNRDDLLRKAALRLGFSRLGHRIRTRLNRIIASDVRIGRLNTSGEKVWKAAE